MKSVMDSFASEVDRLGDPSLAGEQAPANDPLFDDAGDWQARPRNP